MSLILRVDVDKPYGRSNIKEKVLSKLSESFWLPRLQSLGYLNHLRKFIAFLSEEKIKAHIYFRECTLPPKQWLENNFLDGHLIGHHAENTRSFQIFKKEIEKIRGYFFPSSITSFTKHGSGSWKSGRNHYPVYEPKKYLKWADEVNIPYFFGNGDINDVDDIDEANRFYPGMFWIDRYFVNKSALDFQWILKRARSRNIVIIIHPSNFIADKRVKKNMTKIISQAREEGVSWIILET